MCGIAGLFLKNPVLEPQLGALMTNMLNVLTERGPDSAGFAIYGAPTPGRVKFTVRVKPGFKGLSLPAGLEAVVAMHDDHAVISVPAELAAQAQAFLETHAELTIASVGSRMELFKGVGLPQDVSARFGLSGMSGTHAIGHTRMATESAVTTEGAHPFSTGADQCLVHNGSLSNHNDVRRTLIRKGVKFATQNDTEVAAGYLSDKLREGAKLDEALTLALNDLDGFYNFVVGTESGFGVLRDPVSCKPAVMAETEDYVAFASEYRALVGLPGIETARLFEPEPAKVYFWERAA
ncbi:MAG: glutamine amidotransferase family protein [Rhodospirillales bacterium]|nr:glutamine amidotransferase family protein [Rhodospirillales bacterium]MDE1883841.1 glutamine amidotransferase family protein [Rhodospirillales bacterium]MDE2459222.1 glutamine amidotransferase family protein [Rhodospirillales bacterium]